MREPLQAFFYTLSPTTLIILFRAPLTRANLRRPASPKSRGRGSGPVFCLFVFLRAEERGQRARVGGLDERAPRRPSENARALRSVLSLSRAPRARARSAELTQAVPSSGNGVYLMIVSRHAAPCRGCLGEMGRRRSAVVVAVEDAAGARGLRRHARARERALTGKVGVVAFPFLLCCVCNRRTRRRGSTKR